MPKEIAPPSATARYCVVTPYRQKPAAVTISPGHGIRLDLPNYAPGLAVVEIDNLEEARQYSRLKKIRPYKMAITIGLFMLLAACSAPQISENLEEVSKSSPANRDKIPPAGNSRGGLSRFYTALAQLESGQRKRPVVVVHLGDSHIAADRFSGDLRELLQRRFGDAGRGLVQPGKPYRYFNARGMSTQQSEGWKAANSFYNAPGSYSLTGVRLETDKVGETLKLVVKKRRKQQQIEVEFLARPKAGSVEINADDTKQMLDLYAPKTRILRFRKQARELSIKTLDDRRVAVLGWGELLPEPGIRYLSFGLPGATATVMARWTPALVKAELTYLEPDLIILGYGTNEGFKDDLNATAYRQKYEAMAGKLKRLANNPSLLVLGPPDSTRLPQYARKQNGIPGCKALSAEETAQYSKLLSQKSKTLARWHAPPGLARVRKALRLAARDLKAVFWDWSQVMGGTCGTYRWAHAKPALAYGDNVHFTAAGSRRSATALYKFLMKGYGRFS